MSEEKKEELEEEQPYRVDENGQLHCNWLGCTQIFQGDVPGMKAFAAHWAAHKKRGIKPPDQMVKGLTPQELATLVEFRKQYQELAKTAALKTIDQVLSESDRIFEVYVPFFDGKLRYGRLTLSEFISIMDLEEEQYQRKALFLMLRKGDPEVTEEKIAKFEMEEIRQIFFYIVENTPFLFRTRSGTPESSSSPKSKRSP